MWNLFVYKRNLKEKKGTTTDMTLGILSYHRMFSNRKKENATWCLKSMCFSFQKNTFCGKKLS